MVMAAKLREEAALPGSPAPCVRFPRPPDFGRREAGAAAGIPARPAPARNCGAGRRIGLAAFPACAPPPRRRPLGAGESPSPAPPSPAPAAAGVRAARNLRGEITCPRRGAGRPRAALHGVARRMQAGRPGRRIRRSCLRIPRAYFRKAAADRAPSAAGRCAPRTAEAPPPIGRLPRRGTSQRRDRPRRPASARRPA